MATTVKLWLESLLLEQYLATLENSGYETIEKCANLTSSDLDRIGVALPGHKTRILNHLPAASGEVPKLIPDRSAPEPPKACTTPRQSQIYDVPASARESYVASVEEDIYQNVSASSSGITSPTLPPKLKPEKGKDMEWLDDAIDQTPTKRPVPQPRISMKKKPVPKPRISPRKSPSPSQPHHIDTLTEVLKEEFEEEDTEVTSLTESNNTRSGRDSAPVKPPRKLSVKVKGVTQTETDLDQDSWSMENSGNTTRSIDEVNHELSHSEPTICTAPVPEHGPDPEHPAPEFVPEQSVDNAQEHVEEAVIASHEEEPSVSNPSNIAGGSSVYMLSKDVTTPPMVPLSPEDIDFFENPDISSKIESQKPDFVNPLDQTARDMVATSEDDKESGKRIESTASFDDPIYGIGAPATDNNMFQDQLSFDVDAPIPQSLDEWDVATVRQSLMVGAELPNIPHHEDTATSNTCAPILPTLTEAPHFPADRVTKPTTVELGLELYSMPCDVNENIVGKEKAPDSSAKQGCSSMLVEEEDNLLNESLYAEAKLKKQETTSKSQGPDQDPTYFPVWNMKTGEDKNLPDVSSSMWDTNGPDSPDFEDMEPPSFSPPPLPPEAIKAALPALPMSGRPLPRMPVTGAGPPPPPPARTKLSGESIKPGTSVMDSMDNRPLPQLPGAVHGDIPRWAVPMPAAKVDVPTLPQRSSLFNHQQRPAVPLPPTPQRPPAQHPQQTCQPAIHSDLHFSRAPIPQLAGPIMRTPAPPPCEQKDTRPSPPLRAGVADIVESTLPTRPAPPTPSPESKPAVPAMMLKRDKPTPLVVGHNRESFTDLAFDRVSGHQKPALPALPALPESSPDYFPAESPLGFLPSPTIPKTAPPAPPQVLSLHIQDSVMKAQHMDDTPPASPSVYDDIQSDDTLSDGGDWFDSFDFKKPSKEVLKEAIKIVPAVQSNKSTNKSGYLFKRASQEAIRRMGGVWTKRWVELDEKSIRYYSSRKRHITKRVIPVASVLNIEQDMKINDSHPYQFRIITVDRIYTFAADNSDDLSWWSNLLMWGVIDSKDDFEEGGEMSSPDKEGFVKMENVKGKRYFVLKKDKLCYYNTLNDYKAGSPIAQIEMKLAAVKDIGKNKLQIITPAFAKTMLLDSADELLKWKIPLEEAIADGLGDDSVLNEVYENHSNRFCADCRASGPHWASINLAITLCKHCAGIHRMLTLPMSKVRSLRMDFRVWKPPLKKLMRSIGNDNANNFWEWHLREEDMLDADADMSTREDHIVLKYKNKRFCRLHPLNGDQTALNEALQKSVQYGDVQETMQLFFTGADILSHGPNDQTPIQLAQNAKEDLQVEFLYQNGAEGSGQMPITTSMVLDHMMIGGSMFIHHKGYLYKTGSNVKEDFLKRWCVLERGELAYYENEKSAAPKNKLERVEMLSVTVTSDPRFECSFELATTRNGRVFLFAAEQEEDRRKWVNMLAKSMAPVPQELATHVRDFDRAGVLYMRRGSNDSWNKCWWQRKDRNIYYHCKGLRDFEKIDLRKVKSINMIPMSDDCCHEVFYEGPMFMMSLYKDSSKAFTSLYVQGDITKETDTWYRLIFSLLKNSGGTVDEQPLTAEDVPVVVDKCINFVSLHGMRTQGIYRLNGQHSKITKLLEEFNRDSREVTLRQEEHNIHDVSTALKRFFRSLNDSLLTAELYTKWLNTASIQDHSVKLQWYQYLIKELPEVNHCTLKKLVLHLCRVADQESDNKMGSTNIASIFGPILLRVDKDDDAGSGFATTSQEIAVFKDLMDAHMHVFEVKDQEVEHENKMEKARKRMEEALKKSTELAATHMTEMLLHIYIHSKDNQVFTMKVTDSMTADELLKQIQQKTKLQSEKQFAIYECICNEELERPLHPMEKVLAVTLKWASWPKELCKDNIICVKENHVHENIEAVFDPHSSLYSELRYSEKKAFKKYCFEFSQMKMSYKKDSRASSPMCSWNIEDLAVYIGVQQKRAPPTLWGFSFIRQDDKVQGPMFGHSICCNTKEELYRWLAALLHGQSPSGMKTRSPPDGASAHDESSQHTDVSLSPATPPHPHPSTSPLQPSPSTRTTRFKASINKLMRR